MPIEIRGIKPKDQAEKEKAERKAKREAEAKPKRKKKQPEPEKPPTKEDIWYQSCGNMRGIFFPDTEKYSKGIFLVVGESPIPCSIHLGLRKWLEKNEQLSATHNYEVWARTVKGENDEEFLYYYLRGVREELPEWVIGKNHIRVRGQSIFAKDNKICLVVRRNDNKREKFKVQLKGQLPSDMFRPGQFWEMWARQIEGDLVLQTAKLIAKPVKKKFATKKFSKKPTKQLSKNKKVIKKNG